MTQQFYESLPSYEELTVPELHLTWPELKAGSLYFGRFCDEPCKQYMLCKQDNPRNPAVCLNEGKEVTNCGFKFFGKVKKHCLAEFETYYTCLDRDFRGLLDFEPCRKPQLIFDDCMKEKVGMDRPYIGYFARIRLVDSDRPRRVFPKREYKKMKDPPTREELDRYKLNTDQYPLHFHSLFD
ncbi:NADH dehydrogenase [ubiquinone] 1 alpha subcomplex subunit 8-like [Crassostrea angulata]|nr:NADH dehydrogenase [ubiquinone] 1 alpha subcomplex subunit 8 [Crassostrea gigas]XP_034330511.1 NADH dehydrogenase [ubiquinone] 1 alpha subcomplex subunit 8 [Crassostrea gigas]XP_052700725.1 NADH dehydrogenase [ubiquinone] 1 alpha subcomplex subunit 8-like [Crassostrea angulata]|eukprot:XP_011413278.1 PREDICTED: NADH dehydrogenase [ubiquinone] 1 alpha subcomplex subunit 8 [Crassostrea gigas]